MVGNLFCFLMKFFYLCNNIKLCYYANEMSSFGFNS